MDGRGSGFGDPTAQSVAPCRRYGTGSPKPQRPMIASVTEVSGEEVW